MEFKVTLFVAVLAGSSFMFVNPATAAMAELTNPEDDVQKAVGILANGSDNTVRIIKVFKQSAKIVDEIMKKTEKKMEEITELIGSVGRETIRITKDVYTKYRATRKNVRAARRRLRSLADKTKTACEDLELYLEGWDNEYDNQEKKFYLQEQLSIMEALVTESITILKEAEKIYETAIDNIDGVNANLQDFGREMKKMLDTQSAEYNSWTTALRGSVYGTNGVVSIGLLVGDCLGCLGICSSVGNAITWGTTISIVEANIATVTAKLEELEVLVESASADVNALRNTIPQLIQALEHELNIVSDWRRDAEKLDEKLDTLDLEKFARMSLYRRSFEKKLVALRESAENYLNQPVQLFVQESTERRKRSLSEKTLVRKHGRNF